MDRRRSDSVELNPARGVVLAALLGVAFFVLAFGAVAAESSYALQVCADSGAVGGHLGDCAEFSDVPVASIVDGSAVYGCTDAVELGGACTGDGIWYEWPAVSGAGALYSAAVGWVPLSEIFPDGGDGDEEGVIADFDVAVAAAAFGAAFVLVGMFWGLGKAVGLVVNSVRRF
jgi:hypothetical protein